MSIYILTPGTQYAKTNGYKNLIVQEQFEGQLVLGEVELRSNDTRFGVQYSAVSETEVQMLGMIDYDGSGNFNFKRVYS